MNQRFEALLQVFLKPVCPRLGLAYFLRPHPTGVCFPIAALKNGKPLPLGVDSVPHYLLPFRVPPELSNTAAFYTRDDIGGEASLADLAARARLEVLHLDPPVVQNLWRPERTGDDSAPVLLVVSHSQRDPYTLLGDARCAAAADGAAKILELWAECARDSYKLVRSASLAEILAHFARHVGDEEPGPAYFPYLEMDLELAGLGEAARATLVNPLTWNGLIASCGRALPGALPGVDRVEISSHGTNWSRLGAALLQLSGIPPAENTAAWASDVCLAVRPGRNAAMGLGQRTTFALGAFTCPDPSWADPLRIRLEEMAQQARAHVHLLDPVRAAAEAWRAASRAADTLMAEDGLHDVYERSDWPRRLPELRYRVNELVTTGLASILHPFGKATRPPALAPEIVPARSLALHLLWCLRKGYVHPAMVRWAAGLEWGDALPGLPRFLCAAEAEFPEWSVELLRRFHALHRHGGLRDVSFAFQPGSAVASCLFRVRTPERWTAAVLYESPPDDGQPHAIRRTFGFFRQHALPISITRIEPGEAGEWQACTEIRFPAGDIQ